MNTPAPARNSKFAQVAKGLGLSVILIVSYKAFKDGASEERSPSSSASISTTDSKPAPKPEAARPAPVVVAAAVSSKELFAAYEANEIAADGRFKDKVLKVTGVVKSIGKDLMDSPYVSLGTGEQFEILGVQAFFSDDAVDQLARLKKRQTLTVQYRCDGKFGNVMLKECTLG